MRLHVIATLTLLIASLLVVTASESTAPAATTVPLAVYFSNQSDQLAGGRKCRARPPYAFPKPMLPQATPPAENEAAPLLTKELVQKHASPTERFIIVTYVNLKRLDFACTFVKHLKQLGQQHYLVGALDRPALRGLQSNSIPTFLMDAGLTTGDYGWGTRAFRVMGRAKVDLVLALVKFGVNALTVDADAFVLRDPMPYLMGYPRADVLVSSDHLRATYGVADSGLEAAQAHGSAYNIGYMFISTRAVEFVQKWRDACHKSLDAWDQVVSE